MWDDLDDDARGLIAQAARREAVRVVCCQGADPVFMVDGFWNARRTAFACSLDLDNVPMVSCADLDRLHSFDPQRYYDDGIHRTESGLLAMWDQTFCVTSQDEEGPTGPQEFYHGWEVVGKVELHVHGVSHFHGVDKATSAVASATNCVLRANSNFTRLLSEQELEERTRSAQR